MNYDKNIFPKRLKEAMESSRINAKTLSDKIGVNPSAVCRYLQGNTLPRMDKVYAISEALSIDPKWLLGMDDSTMKITDYVFCPWCGRRLR